MIRTDGRYWRCDKCWAYVLEGDYHVCPQEPPAQPVTYFPYYQPNYLPTLESIERSLLRIEKLLEKEL